MLESLFGDDIDDFGGAQGDQGSEHTRTNLTKPPAPRNSTQLSGLSNLGATCYLNSLLQTLHFTAEFRESLFRVGKDELGSYSEEEGADNSHVRIIPVQLQVLFARLLLLNQQSCRVDGLINSFGWTNNEELQQHDVQELNRILFAAIESSLIGTSGEHLIGQLYRGTAVQQIVCQSCGHVSEREEEFLDIPVALTGRTRLEQALKEMYNDSELLEGANQYHCSTCDRLVDAERGCHLRKLPPVLTFALLRFLYNFKKGERYKDTSQFKFPLELDMTPYSRGNYSTSETTARATEEKQLYELYSVVIHSGSTHSGHYTAYIKDVDALGCWTHPNEDPIQMPSDGSTGKVDFIEFDTPTELLETLLRQLGGCAPVDKLCKSMRDKTGVSWNKRFKKQFGSIQQFIKSCPDFFVVDEMKHVSLKTTPTDMPTSPMDTLPATDFELMETAEEVDQGEGQSNDQLTPVQRRAETQGERVEERGRDARVAASDIVEDLSALPFELINTSPTLMSNSQNLSQEQVQDPSDGLSIPSQSGQSTSLLAAHVSDNGAAVMDTDGNTGSKSKGGVAGGHRRSGAKRKVQDGLGTSTRKDPPLPPPPPGQCWFHFNDMIVSPTLAQTLDKMYQGKESAYMLFYRKKSLPQQIYGQKDVVDSIPAWLQCQVTMENTKLEEEKQLYEVAVNTIQLNIHLSTSYKFYNGALHLKEDAMVTVVSIDRRKSITDLTRAVLEVIPEQVGDHMISVARKLPAGMHIYDTISGSESTTIQDLDITDNSNLFVWDGKQVDGELIRTGKSSEPVLLRVTYPITEEEREAGEDKGGERVMEIGRPKDSILGDLRALLASVLHVRAQQVTLSQVKVAERNKSSCVVVLHCSKDRNTLEQMKLCDGDQLAAETAIKKGMKTLAHSVADKQNNLLSVIVEDRCSSQSSDQLSYPVLAMEVTKDTPLSSFKMAILSKINLHSVDGGGRLRLDDDSVGPPLHENQSLDQAGVVQGHRIILEPGLAPTSDQLVLRCMLSSGSKEWEVTVDRCSTVAKCCLVMTQAAALEGVQWHLRKTNWCGEAADVLDDETAVLCKVQLKSGDLLLIEEGKLPPKDFIRLSVSLYTPSFPTYQPSYLTEPAQATGLFSWIMAVIGDGNEQGLTHETDSLAVDTKEVPLHLQSPVHYYPGLPGSLMELDNIEIHRDATIDELKALILTLPALENVLVPTLGFLRVREIVDGQLGKVFKQPQQSLRRNKLATGSHVCVTVLDYEEHLPMTAVVINIQARALGRRSYGLSTEIIYDTSHSTKPSELVKKIALLVDIPSEKCVVAKHKLESFEWIRLQDSYTKEGAKKGRKKKCATASIKNSPVSLRDGDTLGVKDLQYDPEDSDDFTTIEDDRGKAILAALQEEKRRKRKAKSNDVLEGSNQRPRRAEVGIKIFVPDYKHNT